MRKKKTLTAQIQSLWPSKLVRAQRDTAMGGGRNYTDYTNTTNELGEGVKIRTLSSFCKLRPTLWNVRGRNEMDPTEEEVEKKVRERIRHKVNQVSSVSQSLLSPLQDHINFTLQVTFELCSETVLKQS